ncbi:hypothetical protein EXE46_03265 [Halorubrum sp. GN11_10-6_MGM]|uniref:hypothetical protein n=1 Tax=Halorubrum sp. GN11_10-6_MGM TaxID=2518112 RepID=UPI0010F4D1B9|nr:hypothetical protein [Halorubrum sp. GN11_10-6_MGM]TKX75478.1 hypothetical protein EXE46_03265 [Halorubrum sp. GN11_10-6_MGM]
MDGLVSSRRRFLAGAVAGGLGAVAGCLGTGDGGEPSGGDGSALRLSLSRVDGSLRDRYVRDRDDPPERWDEAALDAALADERYTIRGREPFFASADDPTYVLDGETYYELGSVVVDEVAETYPVLRLFAVDGGDDSTDDGDSTADGDGGSAVDAGEDGDLPEADRRAVRIAHFAARARGNVGGYPVGLVERGGYAYRSPSARDDSALLAGDGPDRVVFRDTTYRVDIEHERFHEAVYRPTAEAVAGSPDRMEAILRARLVGPRVAPDDLSPEARRIVERAAAEEYSETHPYSDAYVELLRAIDARHFIDGNIRKDGGLGVDSEEMIRYGEAYYERYLRLSEASDD